ncbi:hypothetical protein KPL74_06585 [Bacillus sp. NP157]|nr:hypothetical protein KPL74_06585 [Bacillus sp. NP157]
MSPSLPCLATLVAALSMAGCASNASRGPTSAPFNLVNATADSVSHVALAPSGSDDFSNVDLGEPLAGGLTAAAVQLPQGPCMRDLRITFGDARESRINGVDVCRTHGLRLDSLRGRNASPDTLATGGPAADQGTGQAL